MSDVEDLRAKVRALEQRLAESEETLRALLSNEVDAVLEPVSASPLLVSSAQRALQQSERGLRAIFEGALDAMLIANDEGRYVDANPSACRIFGLPREELLGLSAGDFAEPGFDFASAWHAFLDVGTESGEFVVWRKDGSRRSLEYRATANILPGRHLSVLRDITERKEAEEARRSAEQKLRALVTNAPVVLVAMDLEGRVLLIEGRGLESLDVRAAGLLGKRVDELDSVPRLTDAPGAPMSMAEMLRRVAAGEVVCGTAQMKTVHYDFCCAAERDEEGAVVGAIAVATDVTGRREAERALQATERRLHALVDTDVLGVFVGHASGDVLEANQAFLDLLGYSEEDLESGRLNWRELTPPEHQPLLDSVQEHLAKTGRARPYVQEYFARDGRRVPILAGVATVDERAGLDVAFVIDLTEQREAEHALRETSAMLEALIRASPAAISVIDLEGRVKLWNPAAEGLFGWTQEEVITEQLPTVSAADLHERLEEIVKGVSFSARRTRRRHRAGHLVDISLSSAPLYDPKGVLVGALDLSVDITEQARLEEQLSQALKMEAVGTLAGGIAHDFNNILAAIMGFCGVIQAELNAHDPLREEMAQIQEAANRGAALTRQLLAFSRKQMLKPRVLDPNQLLVGIERMLRRLIEEHIEVVTELGEEVGCVHVDPGQLEQVVLNLAVNARDAMPEGGVLTLRTARLCVDADEARRHVEVAPGEYVVISVHDTGVGMDRETLARVFEPFFTTKELGKGTGLGLPTAYGIIRQSGGHVRVDSEPGQGATFAVYLPCVDGQAPEVTRPVLPPTSLFGTETVLVAEDEPLVRDFVRQLLRRHGYRVLVAEHGREAMELAHAHTEPIHVLLTDLIMPQLGGRALAEALQRVRPDVKILYMSGYADDTFAARDELPAEAVLLQKPFPPQTLLEALRKVLEPA